MTSWDLGVYGSIALKQILNRRVKMYGPASNVQGFRRTAISCVNDSLRSTLLWKLFAS